MCTARPGQAGSGPLGRPRRGWLDKSCYIIYTKPPSLPFHFRASLHQSDSGQMAGPPRAAVLDPRPGAPGHSACPLHGVRPTRDTAAPPGPPSSRATGRSGAARWDQAGQAGQAGAAHFHCARSQRTRARGAPWQGPGRDPPPPPWPGLSPAEISRRRATEPPSRPSRPSPSPGASRPHTAPARPATPAPHMSARGRPGRRPGRRPSLAGPTLSAVENWIWEFSSSDNKAVRGERGRAGPSQAGGGHAATRPEARPRQT